MDESSKSAVSTRSTATGSTWPLTAEVNSDSQSERDVRIAPSDLNAQQPPDSTFSAQSPSELSSNITSQTISISTPPLEYGSSAVDDRNDDEDAPSALCSTSPLGEKLPSSTKTGVRFRARTLSTPPNPAQLSSALYHSTTQDEKPTRPPMPPSMPSLTSSEKWTRGEGFWRSFIALCIPLLLSALEGSVTNTALPTISSSLTLGTSYSWVATAFLLASTIFQPLYGQLADIWGRKYPMMVAVFVFGIGSAICGWANSGSVLILGRVVQGLGTGGVDLFAEMVLCDIVPLRKRGLYTAIKHTVYAVGTTVGPLLGGVFAERGWRWCFWINIPVCGVSIVVLWAWLSVGGGVKAKDIKLLDELKKVDGWGASLLTSSVILVLVALSQGGADYPWAHPAIVAPMVIGLTGLFAFPFFERSSWCHHPIMPPSIFSNATSRTAFALTAIHGFVTYGVQFYLPPFFQAVRGSSPTTSGIEVLPTTLVIVVLAAIGGPLLSCWGKYKPIHQAGFAVMTLGFGLCTMLSKNTPAGAWVIYQLLVAVGSGIVVSTLLPAVQVELPDTTNGASAGSWAFLRGTGSLFGVAVPGAIFNVRFAQLLPTIVSEEARAKLANGQAYQRASSSFVSKFGPEVKEQIVHGFSEGLKSVWIVFAVFGAVGFMLTFFEKQVKMRKELDTKYGLKTPKSMPNTPASGLSPGNSLPGSGESTPWRASLERDFEKA